MRALPWRLRPSAHPAGSNTRSQGSARSIADMAGSAGMSASAASGEDGARRFQPLHGLPVIQRVVGDAVLACLAPLLAQGLQVADGSRATEVRSAMEERAGNATSSTYWRTQEMFLIQILIIREGNTFHKSQMLRISKRNMLP